MKLAIRVILISASLSLASNASAQGFQNQPVFSGAIINGPGMMVWEQGKASGSGRICGQTYSDDNEKAALLARQARGACGGANPVTNNKSFRSNLLAPPSKQAVSSIKTLTFSPSLQVRKQNFANFVERTRQSDPAGADQLAEMLSSTDVIATIGQAIAPAGLRTNNLADAYAIYWTSAWNASIGSTKTPSRSMMDSVKAQAASALLATPDIISASSAQKQEFAEALFVQAVLIDSSMEQAGNDGNMKRQIGSAVVKGAKAMGLDLKAMKLTDGGFILSGQETGLVQEDDKSQLASVPIRSESTSASNYALIAAAGGAGLGSMFLLGKAMGRKG
jgi:hypothetical protein